MLEDAESGQQRLIDTASAGFRAQLKEQAAARIRGWSRAALLWH